MKKQFENEILKCLEQDFIKPVTSSPKWIFPLVCVPKKKGEVRLCVDISKADGGIIRNYYPTPALHEILYEVNGAEVISKLGSAQDYHKLVLDEKSKNITTSSTPQGLFRFKRLIFGAKNMFGDFRKKIETSITDDIDSVFILVMILLLMQQIKKTLQQLRKIIDKRKAKT